MGLQQIFDWQNWLLNEKQLLQHDSTTNNNTDIISISADGSLIKPLQGSPVVAAQPISASPTSGDPIAGLHGKIIAFAEEKKITYEDAYNTMSKQGLIRI